MVTATAHPVGLADVQAARELLAGVVAQTPIAGSRDLSARRAGPVWLKCENLQRTGSFKIRGAYNRIARLTTRSARAGWSRRAPATTRRASRSPPGCSASTATVFMPIGAAMPKVAATRGYGADVRLDGAHRRRGARRGARGSPTETGAVLVHPFDHLDIIAGQGTVGLEILEQVPDVRTVLVLHRRRRAARRRRGGGQGPAAGRRAWSACRPHGAAAWPASLAEGTPVPLPSMRTIADGIAVGRPGDVTFAHVAALVDDDRHGQRGRVVPRAAALPGAGEAGRRAGGSGGGRGADRAPRRFATPVVAVLSGGNVDPLRAAARDPARPGGRGALPHAAGAPRRPPGALAGLLDPGGRPRRQRARRGARAHVGGPPLGEVDVRLSMETRGPQHCAELVAALQPRATPSAYATPATLRVRGPIQPGAAFECANGRGSAGVRTARTAPPRRARPSCCRHRAAGTRGCRRRARR